MYSADLPPRQWWLVSRLLRRALTACALVWGAGCVFVLYYGYVEVQSSLDRSLQRAAEAMLTYVDYDLSEVREKLGVALVPDRADPEGYRFQVWSPDGRLLVRSDRMPLTSMPNITQGFEDLEIAGGGWRIYVLRSDTTGAYIQIAQRDSVRHDVIRRNLVRLIIAPILGGMLLFVLLGLIVRAAVKPVAVAAVELGRRNLGNLEPIPAGQLPGELSPLVSAFNDLLERLGRAMESERRFTADAAHELRTPLAAIRLQAQLAQRATSREDLTRAHDRLIIGVDRATRLIEQLLVLARFDPESELERQLGTALISSVIYDVVAELEPQISERKIRLRTIDDGEAIVVPAEAVRILLRNLLENAIRYSPPESGVELRSGRVMSGWYIEVSDEGPGIPQSQRERVFERFVRLQRGRSGSGLGLSIVHRIVQLLKGQLVIGEGTEGKGTKIRIIVP